MSKSTITIPVLARVEGEGALNLEITDQKITFEPQLLMRLLIHRYHGVRKVVGGWLILRHNVIHA